jgi:MFS family permease
MDPEATLSRHNTQSESLHRPSRSNDESTDNQNGDLTRIKSIAQQMSPLRELFFVGIICAAQFTTQMGLGQTLAILHVIGDSLHITNPGVLSWLIAGYSLTVGSFILISGRFGDIFGYKEMMVIGYTWYAVWSMVAGLAIYSGEVLFIFARVMSGIGPAIMLPNALGLLGATYAPGERKNMVFSLFGACAPIGSIVGGLFAGLWSLLENGWPWTFYTMAIALFILAALSMVILPTVPVQPEYQNLSLKEKFIELDLLGATVGITAMILFNFAWNQAPGFGWEQPYIYVLLIIGILLFPVFFWIELNIAAKPLIPFDALSGDVSFVLGCVACGWASFGEFSREQVGWKTELIQNRYLDILHIPISPDSPWRQPSSQHRPRVSCRRLRNDCRFHNWKSHRQTWTWLGDVHRDVCILDGQHNPRHNPYLADILGADLRLYPHYSMGHGYEFSSRNAHSI